MTIPLRSCRGGALLAPLLLTCAPGLESTWKIPDYRGLDEATGSLKRCGII